MTASIEITIPINLDRVASLLVTAFEGGTGYWCGLDDANHVKPAEIVKLDDFEDVYPHVHYPLSVGGSLALAELPNGDWDDPQNVNHVLDLPTIINGLARFARDYPWHFSNLMSNNEDAETGDAFLQCCLFGILVYS